MHGHAGIAISGIHIESRRLPGELRRSGAARLEARRGGSTGRLDGEARRGGSTSEFEAVEDRVRWTGHHWIGSGRDDTEMTTRDRATVLVSAATGGDPTTPVIGLGGELDLARVEAPKAGSAPYRDASTRTITFDLEKVTYMDSSEIALLEENSNDIGRVPLINEAATVRRLLETTGMLENVCVDS